MQLLLLMASPMFGVFFEFIQMTRSICVSANGDRALTVYSRHFYSLRALEKVHLPARTCSEACGMEAEREMRRQRGVFQVALHRRVHISMTFVLA